ncbi:hypothetical protein STEG23_023004 [Scotinomys teguina]
MEVVTAAPRYQLLLILLMAAMLLLGMKGSPLLVRRKIARTIKLQESISKELNYQNATDWISSRFKNVREIDQGSLTGPQSATLTSSMTLLPIHTLRPQTTISVYYNQAILMKSSSPVSPLNAVPIAHAWCHPTWVDPSVPGGEPRPTKDERNGDSFEVCIDSELAAMAHVYNPNTMGGMDINGIQKRVSGLWSYLTQMLGTELWLEEQQTLLTVEPSP